MFTATGIKDERAKLARLLSNREFGIEAIQLILRERTKDGTRSLIARGEKIAAANARRRAA